MKQVRIGLIGSGYIGKAHAIAYAQAGTVFELQGQPVLEMLAETTPELAAQRARAFGFRHATADWRELVQSPHIDVVDICAPNYLHKEMALAAIRHGKHVYCEKPLALNAHDARELVQAAEQAGVKTLVGFNYMKNPAAQLAKQIIDQGEIGELIHFYGTHNEDYMADANIPMHWHCLKSQAGLGALGDLSAHIFNMAQYLLGDITEVCGDLKIVVPRRPLRQGASEMAQVENEDQAHAMVRFASGCQGIIESSRVACGRKMGLSYQITGSKGAISFTQERMAELKVFFQQDPVSRQGFRTLLLGPAHPDYAPFCQGAGHGFGFNDQKTIEIRDLLNAVAGNSALWPDFTEAWKVSRILDAVVRSHEESRWVKVTEIV